jgi:hypothetical protein
MRFFQIVGGELFPADKKIDENWENYLDANPGISQNQLLVEFLCQEKQEFFSHQLVGRKFGNHQYWSQKTIPWC